MIATITIIFITIGHFIVSLIIAHARYILSLIFNPGVTVEQDTNDISLYMLCSASALVTIAFNSIFIAHFIPLKSKWKANFLQIAAIVAGYYWRLHQRSNMDGILGISIVLLITLFLTLVIAISLKQALIELNKEQTKEISKVLVNMRAIKKVSEDYQDMLESLEEGIVVVKNDRINFTNKIFKQIIKRLNLDYEDEAVRKKLLDLKIFKVFRSGAEENDNSVSEMSRRN